MKAAIAFIMLLALIAAIRIHLVPDLKPGESVSTFYTFLAEPVKNYDKQSFRYKNVLVVTNSDYDFVYGDKVYLEGVVEEKKSSKGYYLTIQDARVLKTDNKNPILVFIQVLRDRVREVFHRYLPPDEASLLIGIVFGIKEKLSGNFSDALRNSGVTHVIAASGANVSMVAAVMLAIFTALFKRRWALVLTTIGVLFYALFSGFSASVVRASLMAITAYIAQGVGRQNTGIITLAIVGLIMIIIQPMNIIDVGFMLSIASTFGILTIKPILDRVVFKSFIKDDLTTTLSAQIATFPILATVFTSYSIVSLLVNILVLWTIPILMIFGMIAALIGIVFPPICSIFLLLAHPFLIYFKGIVIWFDQFKVLEFQNGSLFFVLGYYLLLLVFIVKIRIKKS